VHVHVQVHWKIYPFPFVLNLLGCSSHKKRGSIVKILMAGATGLVGRLVLQHVLADSRIERVHSVGRRGSGVHNPKLFEHIGPMERWPDIVSVLESDAAISTLGTTIRQAGSEEAFWAVDHDAQIAFARASCGIGVRHFLSVGSVGAHAGSRNFYLATKGKIEAALGAVGFERLDLFRPGLLRGSRTGPLRPGERIGMLISPITDILTPRRFDHYRSIAADDVAKAIVAKLFEAQSGKFIHENRAMLV
jgi:uncharacterized protein YbjT (DUF2867 family)